MMNILISIAIFFAVVSVGLVGILIWDRSLKNKNKEPETKPINAGKITLDIHFKDGTVWKEYQVFVGNIHNKIVSCNFFPFFKPFLYQQKIYSATGQCDNWLNGNNISTVFFYDRGKMADSANSVGYPLHEVQKFVEHHEDHFVDIRIDPWRSW